MAVMTRVSAAIAGVRDDIVWIAAAITALMEWIVLLLTAIAEKPDRGPVSIRVDRKLNVTGPRRSEIWN
jgi:hypothetical protein